MVPSDATTRAARSAPRASRSTRPPNRPSARWCGSGRVPCEVVAADRNGPEPLQPHGVDAENGDGVGEHDLGRRVVHHYERRVDAAEPEAGESALLGGEPAGDAIVHEHGVLIGTDEHLGADAEGGLRNRLRQRRDGPQHRVAESGVARRSEEEPPLRIELVLRACRPGSGSDDDREVRRCRTGPEIGCRRLGERCREAGFAPARAHSAGADLVEVGDRLTEAELGVQSAVRWSRQVAVVERRWSGRGVGSRARSRRAPGT